MLKELVLLSLSASVAGNNAPAQDLSKLLGNSPHLRQQGGDGPKFQSEVEYGCSEFSAEQVRNLIPPNEASLLFDGRGTYAMITAEAKAPYLKLNVQRVSLRIKGYGTKPEKPLSANDYVTSHFAEIDRLEFYEPAGQFLGVMFKRPGQDKGEISLQAQYFFYGDLPHNGERMPTHLCSPEWNSDFFLGVIGNIAMKRGYDNPNDQGAPQQRKMQTLPRPINAN